jgi:hypothetical protein
MLEIINKVTRSKLDEAEAREALEGKEDKNRAAEKIFELVEIGKGTEIPGVKGTAYGLLNAFTEYVDHHRPVRRLDGRPLAEARWETITTGSGARLKDKAFKTIYQYALAA